MQLSPLRAGCKGRAAASYARREHPDSYKYHPLSACTDGCSDLSRATRKMVQILFPEQKCLDFFFVWHSRNVPRPLAARFGGWVSRPGCFRKKKIIIVTCVEKGGTEVGVNGWREGGLQVLRQK